MTDAVSILMHLSTIGKTQELCALSLQLFGKSKIVLRGKFILKNKTTINGLTAGDRLWLDEKQGSQKNLSL